MVGGREGGDVAAGSICNGLSVDDGQQDEDDGAPPGRRSARALGLVLCYALGGSGWGVVCG